MKMGDHVAGDLVCRWLSGIQLTLQVFEEMLEQLPKGQRELAEIACTGEVGSPVRKSPQEGFKLIERGRSMVTTHHPMEDLVVRRKRVGGGPEE
jgi:hypothetical protein